MIIFPQEFQRQVQEMERQLAELKHRLSEMEREDRKLEGQRGLWQGEGGALVDETSHCERLEQDLSHVLQVIADGVESGSLKVWCYQWRVQDGDNCHGAVSLHIYIGSYSHVYCYMQISNY